MNLETAYVNFGTMYKSVEAAAIPDQHNEEDIESEVLPVGASGSPKDLDVYTSYNPYSNVETMDEAVEANVAPDQHNEESAEA